MYDIKANTTMSKMPIILSSVSDAEISAKPTSITPNKHNAHTQTFTNVFVVITLSPQLLALSVPPLMQALCKYWCP